MPDFLQQNGFIQISRGLQFRVCNPGEPCAIPHTRRQGEPLYRGERKSGGSWKKQGVSGFSLVESLPEEKRSPSSSVIFAGHLSSPSGFPTLLIEVSVYYYYYFTDQTLGGTETRDWGSAGPSLLTSELLGIFLLPVTRQKEQCLNCFLDGSDTVALWVGLTSVGSAGTVPWVQAALVRALGGTQSKGRSGPPGGPCPPW